MKYRALGRSGLHVSEVALGSYLTYGAGLADASGMGCLRRAFELGINLFDTADTYGHGRAEELLGAAARELGRQHLVLATKCFFPMSDDPNDRGLSRKHLFDSVHASLRRLGTDYIDLFQCHRFDPETPLEETVGALADLVRQGKILYWGVSRWSGEQVRASVETARARVAPAPISNQYPYHALYREMEGETLEACAASGVGMIAHSPLAQGVLSGKYAGGAPPGSRGAQADLAPQMYQLTPADMGRANRLARIAGEAGLRPAVLAIAWTLRLPGVASAVVGATRVDQVEENVAASGVTLSADVQRAIDAALASAEEPCPDAERAAMGSKLDPPPRR